eukprot:TRINITY_DN17196_c0_g1_i1.p3 TRINITY_DN17196_c0_g1~~TRINITY_DN17196_c0_g1_i1.p3  ORF type:complete len:246 (+),score=36.50 TRINITY_DN17196_c0_g1_i1:78-815(+)
MLGPTRVARGLEHYLTLKTLYNKKDAARRAVFSRRNQGSTSAHPRKTHKLIYALYKSRHPAPARPHVPGARDVWFGASSDPRESPAAASAPAAPAAPPAPAGDSSARRAARRQGGQQPQQGQWRWDPGWRPPQQPTEWSQELRQEQGAGGSWGQPGQQQQQQPWGQQYPSGQQPEHEPHPGAGPSPRRVPQPFSAPRPGGGGPAAAPRGAERRAPRTARQGRVYAHPAARAAAEGLRHRAGRSIN